MDGDKSSQVNYQLCAVYVFTRHGSRTPCHPDFCMDVEFSSTLMQHPSYTMAPIEVKYEGQDKLEDWINPTGPFLNGGKCIPGQLVSKGAIDQYNLGRKLRKIYIDDAKLLESECVDVVIHSSKRKRTVESARCILAGLYPDCVNSKTTVPVHVSDSMENMILPYNPYSMFLAQNIKDNARMIPGLQDAVNAVKANMKTKNDIDLSNIWDNLETMKELDLFPQVSDSFLELISVWGRKWFIARVLGTQEYRFNILRFSCGMIIDFILRSEESVNLKRTTSKFFLFSGHDCSLLCLLFAMGLHVAEIPRTSSCLRLEIHENNEKEKFIKVIYNDEEMQIAGNQQPMCPFSKFADEVSKYRITKSEYKSQCDLHDTKPRTAQANKDYFSTVR